MGKKENKRPKVILSLGSYRLFPHQKLISFCPHLKHSLFNPELVLDSDPECSSRLLSWKSFSKFGKYLPATPPNPPTHTFPPPWRVVPTIQIRDVIELGQCLSWGRLHVPVQHYRKKHSSFVSCCINSSLRSREARQIDHFSTMY